MIGKRFVRGLEASESDEPVSLDSVTQVCEFVMTHDGELCHQAGGSVGVCSSDSPRQRRTRRHCGKIGVRVGKPVLCSGL